MNKSSMIVIGLGVVILVAIIGLAFWNKHQVEQSAQTTASATTTPSKEAHIIMDATTPTTTPDGLQIHDTVIGTGAEAKEGSTISVKYTGTLLDGSVFDSTDSHGGNPVTFQLSKGKLIDGWVEGIPGMKVGGKRTLVIPASLAYGAQSQPGIPANSTLHFDIELVDVK